MLLPRPLKLGDTIAIIAPSDSITDCCSDANLQAGIRFLRDSGFQLSEDQRLSPTSPVAKAHDLMRAFSDNTVTAIIAAQGGNSAEKVLPFVDWGIIRSNPKIFMGISDITVLLNAIYSKTGLITFHGNDVKFGFGRNPQPYDRDQFLERLVQGAIGEVMPNGPRRCVRPGRAEGTLLGGNLRCLLKLSNTDCWPEFEDAVLMLEAFELTPESCREYLEQLQRKNVFDKVQGVIIGYIYGMQALHPELPQLEDLLLEYTSSRSFPILKVNDFGHNCPNTVLPIGGKIAFDAQKLKLSVVEACLK